MLKTERNTPTMGARIERAFVVWCGNPPASKCRPDAAFEHGQWWITELNSGAQYSVVDAEGGRSVDGFDFEQVSGGEEF